MPDKARRRLGHELNRLQCGDSPRDWKPMPAVGAGVLELRSHVDGAFRLLCVVTLAEVIFVLHCFQKKSRKTASLDLTLARQRYQAMRRLLTAR